MISLQVIESFREALPRVLQWVEDELEAHRTRATSVPDLGFKRLPDYFSEEQLERAWVITGERVPVPPLRALGLSGFDAFEEGTYAGITYQDTFFVERSHSAAESLHFHLSAETRHCGQSRSARAKPVAFLHGRAGYAWTFFRISLYRRVARAS